MEAEGRRQSNACGYAKCMGGNPPKPPFHPRYRGDNPKTGKWESKAKAKSKKPAQGMEAEGCRQSNACGYAKCMGGNPPRKTFFHPPRIKLSKAYRRRRRTSSAAPAARGRPGVASAARDSNNRAFYREGDTNQAVYRAGIKNQAISDYVDPCGGPRALRRGNGCSSRRRRRKKTESMECSDSDFTACLHSDAILHSFSHCLGSGAKKAAAVSLSREQGGNPNQGKWESNLSNPKPSLHRVWRRMGAAYPMQAPPAWGVTLPKKSPLTPGTRGATKKRENGNPTKPKSLRMVWR